ncbi:MAG: hypothetical protein ACM3P0_01930 [Acidobacteriota bacterium]
MVNIEGDVTISNISSIKSALQEDLRENSSLSIAIKDISQMDITFLQLLLSLESATSKVTIAVEPGSEKRIYEFSKNYGYYKEIKMSNTEN